MKALVGCVCQRTKDLNNKSNVSFVQIKGALANAPYGEKNGK